MDKCLPLGRQIILERDVNNQGHLSFDLEHVDDHETERQDIRQSPPTDNRRAKFEQFRSTRHHEDKVMR